jgi:phospholipase A1/A2
MKQTWIHASVLVRSLPILMTLVAIEDLRASESTGEPRSAEACVAIEIDAERLACYDGVLGHTPASTEQADKAAQAAEAELSEETADEEADDIQVLREEIANAGKGSLLDGRWELAQDSKLGTFEIRSYKPVYLLPAFWTSDVNETPTSPNPDNTVTTPADLMNVEVKFQLSFKTKLAENLIGQNGDLWAAYTQSSRFQLYNASESRPFRETDYEPELMLAFRTAYGLLGWKGRLAAVGVVHQSNGQSDPWSRSWNRLVLTLGLDRENWALVLRPWFRFHGDADNDDNPDIEDYMGRGDVMLAYQRNRHEVVLTARHSLRGGDRSHGSLKLDWSFPISSLLRGQLEIFSGYGESLIDYNHKATYIGVGIALSDWF